MKHIIYILLLAFCPLATLQADNLTPIVSVVPCPVQMVPGTGNFLFSGSTVLRVENAEQARVARNFVNLFTRAAGFTPVLKTGKGKGDVCFVTDPLLKSEAYRLSVSPEQISIEASDAKGFFYALQTIRQLLPPDIENSRTVNAMWTVPCLTIQDEPRFGYRGLMLDVSRFFIPKESVLRIIDCMAMLKINKLHFHLVDDNGWRLEIKKYPRLTEIGAWRVDHTDVPFHSRRNPLPGEPTPVGGFYTQEDMKEMIAYAADRQVEIIPEIEMPAHTNSSLAAYPQLACPVVDQFIGVLPGLGGDHASIIYCAGNDSVFTFLQNVIDEVAALFPSRYIHLGGDEAQKTYWKKCPLCQERMKKEHLAHEEDLQGYFMKRIGEYVRSKGKEVMGWDELTNSFIPEGAVIFGWQGMGNAALKAADRGHRFVMTPARVMYLIRYQGPQWFEPLTYFGNNTLKDVYQYEPVQKNWKPEYASLLMGVQASLWTEFCNCPEDVDYLVFPRLAALAEVGWSRPEQKNWDLFLKAMDRYNEHLDVKGIGYARSMYNIHHTSTPVDGAFQIKLECIRPDVEIRYTTDGSEPEATSTLYTRPLEFHTAQTLKCATFAAGRQMGKTLVLPLLHNKATAKPIFTQGASGASVLTNGVRGSLKQTDFEWCSWSKSDCISFTLDLQKDENIHTFTLGSITVYGMAVHKPESISVALSSDNVNFTEVGEKHFTPEEIFREGTYVEDLKFDLGTAKARYVRVTARGVGKCPPDHVRPGQEARIFFDEIIVE